MNALLFDLGLALAILFTTLAICIAVELLVPIERANWKSRLTGTAFSAILTVSYVMASFFLAKLWRVFDLRLPLPPVEQWAGWLAVPVTLVAADLLKYWEHRFEHRFMWSVHKVHHSPTELHAANAYGHPIQAIPVFCLMTVPLSLLNFDTVATPIAASLVIGFITVFIHSPVDFHFGPLRHLLVDNRFHRIHHSLEPRHFDRNYGVILTIWDRIFRTAHFPGKAEWPMVGVAGTQPPSSVAEFLTLPFTQDGKPGQPEDLPANPVGGPSRKAPFTEQA